MAVAVITTEVNTASPRRSDAVLRYRIGQNAMIMLGPHVTPKSTVAVLITSDCLSCCGRRREFHNTGCRAIVSPSSVFGTDGKDLSYG